MKMPRKTLVICAMATVAAGICVAQGWGWNRRHSQNGIVYTEGRVPVDENTVRTAREIASGSTGTPNWTNEPGFEKDVFTLVRLIRDRAEDCSPSAGSWITDFPDSDLNLS